MTYIFLAAGQGLRLSPLTLQRPKPLYKLDANTTVLQRMINLIREFDSQAEIVVVLGYMAQDIRACLDDEVHCLVNPFYKVTNSIASLWFAKEYLKCDHVTIINGDIVVEKELARTILCKATDKPLVLIDSSIRNNGDYNVQVKNEKILVMSKELNEYYGEYAGITQLDRTSAQKLSQQIVQMVMGGFYDQWYEDALVQMIFNEDFILHYQDISNYKWTEVDSVSDMMLAKTIHLEN